MEVVNLTSVNIYELAVTMIDKLREYSFYDEATITLPVDADTFKKVDEDLYYRNFPDGDDFVPSDREINVQVENVLVKLVKKEEKA